MRPDQITRWLIILLVLFVTPLVRAEDKITTLQVAADGFPAGHETPEGAAADLARAFIRHDVQLFNATCIKPFAGGVSRREYSAFLKATGDSIREAAQRQDAVGPKELVKLFAARSLSQSGPASYGYAVFGFRDVKFVDVLVLLKNGSKYRNRTLVLRDKTGKWYAHPLPGSSPLLSAGLNEESESTTDFGKVYRVQK